MVTLMRMVKDTSNPYFVLNRHMQILQQRSPGLRMSSDLSSHHLGFQDPCLVASLFRPTEEKYSAKRWQEPVEPTPRVESKFLEEKEPA